MTTRKLGKLTLKKNSSPNKTAKRNSSPESANPSARNNVVVTPSSKRAKVQTTKKLQEEEEEEEEEVQAPKGERSPKVTRATKTAATSKTAATIGSKKRTILPFDVIAAAKHVSIKDKKMAQLIRNVGPCRLELMEMHNCFETLIESIVYQQLTAKAASTILGRVKGLYGDKFPSPKQLLKTKDQDLRTVGLSGSKTAALKDLAEKTLNGDLPEIEMLHSMEDAEIVEKLSAVRGIGEWTVQMLLIFKLGRPDVMPSNDYGVRKGYAKTFKLKELPAPKELLRLSEKWRPYRTIASWYLWRSLELP